MGAVSIMAAILEDELRGRGIRGLTRSDCESIIRSMIERTAEFGEIKQRQLRPPPGEQAPEALK
jgi:hypothetical protein